MLRKKALWGGEAEAGVIAVGSYRRLGLKRWMRAHRARPLAQEEVRSHTLTPW